MKAIVIAGKKALHNMFLFKNTVKQFDTIEVFETEYFEKNYGFKDDWDVTWYIPKEYVRIQKKRQNEKGRHL